LLGSELHRKALGCSDDLIVWGFPRGRKSDSRLAFGGQLWKANYFGMISGSGSSRSFRAVAKASAVRAAMAGVS
jgi:hypothetical protein